MSPSGPLEGNSRAGKIRSTLGSHEMKLGIRPRGRGKFVRMALAQRGDLRIGREQFVAARIDSPAIESWELSPANSARCTENPRTSLTWSCRVQSGFSDPKISSLQRERTRLLL